MYYDMLKGVVSLKRLMGVALMGALAALLTGCNVVTPEHSQSTFDTLGPVAENQLFIFWVNILGRAGGICSSGRLHCYTWCSSSSRREDDGRPCADTR